MSEGLQQDRLHKGLAQALQQQLRQECLACTPSEAVLELLQWPCILQFIICAEQMVVSDAAVSETLTLGTVNVSWIHSAV